MPSWVASQLIQRRAMNGYMGMFSTNNNQVRNVSEIAAGRSTDNRLKT